MTMKTNREKVSKPLICLIDTAVAVNTALTEYGLTISSGTLGTRVDISADTAAPYRTVRCLPNYSVPPNLQEYDIVVVDMNEDEETKRYIEDEHERPHISGSTSTFIIGEYPDTLFDPRPIGAAQIRSPIKEVVSKEGILIVFLGRNYALNYTLANITSDGSHSSRSEEHSAYDFIPVHLYAKNKYGEQVFLQKELNPFSSSLERHCSNCRYHATINNIGIISHFVPLLRNSANEVIGGLMPYEKGIIIILPDIQDKPAFLRELLTNELPGMYPSLFPHHTEGHWLEDSPYCLPNHETLMAEKEDIDAECRIRVTEIEERIVENKEKYSWLHGLLTKDGEDLVRDVQKFLEWLGFNAVRYMDDFNKTSQEEDLQVDIPQGLLVIEVKGITGTSKDEDCNQISKIKYRRAKERNSFDVYALYIVNHQKHLPPLERENPPFKPEQIGDAKNEERGLLTTWQLFNLYFSIEAGGIKKDEARTSLIKSGLVDFKPHGCEELGKPKNVLKDGYVVLFDVETPISISDSLIILRDERYYKVKILSLKSNDQSIQKIESGSIGIKIDYPVKGSDSILLRRSSGADKVSCQPTSPNVTPSNA